MTTGKDDKLTSPGRKISLGTEHCPFTGHSSGGDDGCDHDFDPKPTRDGAEFTEWACTRCGMNRRYEIYD